MRGLRAGLSVPVGLAALVLAIAPAGAATGGSAAGQTGSPSTTATTAKPGTTATTAKRGTTATTAGRSTAPKPPATMPANFTVPTVPAPKSKRVVDAPTTIAADCSVDVTDQLRRWIGGVPNRVTARLQAGACYRIDGTLSVREKSRFTIDGNGATLQAGVEGDQARRHVVIADSHDVFVHDLTVRGANELAGATKAAYRTGRAFQHGFSLNSVRRVRLEKVAVYDVFGDFVYVGIDGPDGTWSDGVTVVDSDFAGSGRQGISVVAGKNVVIRRNTIEGVPLSLIDLEANTDAQGAQNILIADNTTGAAGDFWLANKGNGYNINNIEITGNHMEAPTGNLIFVYGPRGGYRGPFTITDNVMVTRGTTHDEGSVGSMFFSQAANVKITGNTVVFPADRQVLAVQAQDSLNVTVTNNRFVNADRELMTNTRPKPTG